MNLVIIQARMGSTRLPGKILKAIGGAVMLRQVVKRANMINNCRVVVNVPLDDHPLISSALPDTFVVGMKDQEKDVLGSFRELAREWKADTIMRLTGDCPLLDPDLCSRVLAMFHGINDTFCFCANDTVRSGYPDGTDCEVFSVQGLELAYQHAREPIEREHVTMWMRKHLTCYTILAPYGSGFYEQGHLVKWSVDTDEDLARVRGIYEQLTPGAVAVEDTWHAYKSYCLQATTRV